MSPNNPVANRRVLEPEHCPKRIMLGSLVLNQMTGTQSAVSRIAAPFTVTLLTSHWVGLKNDTHSTRTKIQKITSVGQSFREASSRDNTTTTKPPADRPPALDLRLRLGIHASPRSVNSPIKPLPSLTQ